MNEDLKRQIGRFGDLLDLLQTEFPAQNNSVRAPALQQFRGSGVQRRKLRGNMAFKFRCVFLRDADKSGRFDDDRVNTDRFEILQIFLYPVKLRMPLGRTRFQCQISTTATENY